MTATHLRPQRAACTTPASSKVPLRQVVWITGLLLAGLFAGARVASAQAPLAFEWDERLMQPRSYIAADIGTWSDDGNVTKSNAFFAENPPNSGLKGLYYEECTPAAKLWHAQHIVRLPNKDGAAYFMASHSDYAGTASRGGYITLIKIARAAVDANDLISPDNDGARPGVYIWEDRFTSTNPRGHWNHPGRMEVVGGLLVVAMEQFDGGPCLGGEGTSNQALAFYDIRDPEHPRHIATVDSTGTVNAVGILNPRTLPYWVISVNDALNGHNLWCQDYVLSPAVLGGVPQTAPSWHNWIPCAANPAGGGLASQYGGNFNSYEMRKDALGPDCRAVPGGPQQCIERSFRFQPYPTLLFGDDEFEFGEVDLNSLTISAITRFPVNLPDANRHWEDMSTYVTRNGMVVAYALNNNPWTYANGAPQAECTYVPIVGIDYGQCRNARIVQMYNVADLALRTPLQSQRVTSMFDIGPGTLREAISYGGTVTFDPALNGATIYLDAGPLVAYLYDVTIDASALPAGITISGRGALRVFEVARGVNVTLRNLTLTGGRAVQGAGLRNMGGTVTLENCRVVGNEATWPFTNQGVPSNAGDGGGILNGARQWRNPEDDNELQGTDAGGNLTLIGTTVSGNTARRGGGGIANLGGVLTVENSTISGNIAYAGGGGLYNRPGLMDGTTARPAIVRLLSSTVANNTLAAEALGGGTAGIENAGGGELSLVHSLVAGNTQPSPSLVNFAAGINNTSGGTLTLEYSVVANNVVQYAGGVIRDVQGPYCPYFGNLFTAATGAVPNLLCNFPAQVGDPGLSPLGNHGGPTQTMLPLPGSRLIDNADTGTLPPSDPVNLFDQRGVPRPQGTGYDTGPVEVMPLATAIEATEVSGVASAISAGSPEPWFGQNTVTHDGVDAAQSGTSGNNQSSGMSAAVTGPGTLSFWWKVSSDGADALYFILDGNTNVFINGELGWTQVNVSIPSGSHSLAWVYLKTSAGAAGADAGWVDQVVFTHPPAVVTNATDGATGSLRNIIAGLFPGDVITMGAGLSGQTITLTSGQLVINKAITIDASSLPAGLTISGNDVSRVFDISSGGNLNVTGVSIVRGRVDLNSAGNTRGGCIQNAAGGTLTLHRSTVSDCRAATAGGIMNLGTMLLDNVTVSRNTAPDRAGIFSGGPTTLFHTTISDNATLAGSEGPGAGYFGGSTAATLSIGYSIIAGNRASGFGAPYYPDVFFNGDPVVITGPNLIGNNSGGTTVFPAGPLVGTQTAPLDPKLAPLGSFGGPTRTMLPLAGSPAVDAAAGSSDAMDQRNVTRPQGAARDLGSVEVRSTDRSDGDGDGVADGFDNCTLVGNLTQLDTNGDGYGNICDPDFNNNGIVDSQDGALLKAAFGSSAFPDRDMNGNGIVDSNDGARLKARFGQAPGPSALRP